MSLSFFGPATWNTSVDNVVYVTIPLLQGGVQSQGDEFSAVGEIKCYLSRTNFVVFNVLIQIGVCTLTGTGGSTVFILPAFRFSVVNPIWAQQSPQVNFNYVSLFIF